jgi:ABC-2 type transport system permease protein
MRKVLAIAWLRFRLVLRSRGAFISMFLLPLLFTFIFGSMAVGDSAPASSGRRYPVAVVAQDQSLAARMLVETLQQHPQLKVELIDREQMTRRFVDRQIDSGVVIPAGFEEALLAGKAVEVEIVTPPGGNVYLGVGPIIRKETSRLTTDFLLARERAGSGEEAAVRAAYAKVQEDRSRLEVTVRQEQAVRPQAQQVDRATQMGYLGLGFIVTFMMSIVFNMGGVILQEREQHTWGRLLTAPVHRAAILGGYLASFLLVGLFQFTVLMVASRLLFGVHWGPLLPLYTVAAATILCAGGMGLFLAGIVRTSSQQAAVGTLVVNATSMLGGAYWPLDMVGETMRRIGYLTPQAWALQGLRDVLLRGATWEALAMPLTVLVAMAAVFLAAGMLRVRYD